MAHYTVQPSDKRLATFDPIGVTRVHAATRQQNGVRNKLLSFIAHVQWLVNFL